MSIELQILAWSVVLGLVHIVIAAHVASRQRGYRWAAGARDGTVAPLTGIAGRLDRALRNFLETFAFFAALVLAVQLAGRNGTLSEYGAIMYLSGRVIYLPLYAFGVPLLRSLVWNISTIGIMLLIVALLR